MSFDEFRAAVLSTNDPEEKERNKELVERYPFLLPRYDWSQELLEDYDYGFTNLDDLPKGWVKAFGLQMCEDLRKILVEANYLEEYRILQWKEKWGRLTIYSGGYPNEIADQYNAWEDKYEKLSTQTCIGCGKPGKMVYSGWISPWCKDCFYEHYSDNVSYEEYTKEPE